MKIGIIGSTGFIGNNLYFYLSKFKNYKVFRYSSFKKNNKYWINKVSQEIKTTKPNIILNCDEISNVFISILKQTKDASSYGRLT